MNRNIVISLTLATLLILLIAVQFFYFNNRLTEFGTSMADTGKIVSELRNKQEESLAQQHEANEKIKNDFEKYKMLALETNELVTSNHQPKLSSIVKNWRPYTAYIICSWDAPEELYGSGSGKIEEIDSEGRALIMTNKHVLLKEDNKPSECLITFPEISKIYRLEDPDVITEDDLDVGYLIIEDPDQFITSLAMEFTGEAICLEEAKPGDEILAIGYPGIGVSGDVTVTDGIISGIEGEYYISSVKLDYGNSGGIAILVEKNCYLGIPTASVTGKIESLAKILKYDQIKDLSP